MKKIIIPILVLAATACTKEFREAPVTSPQRELTIMAYAGDQETRTERSPYGTVLWNPGDEISVFCGSGADGGSRFTAQNTEKARITSFTGSMSVVTGGNDVSMDDTYFWAVYPYNAAASCDGSSVTTVLPSEQLAVPNTFADDLFLTLGHSKGLSMPFYNICGGIKFTLSEEGITSVTLKGNNGELLAGTITVGLDESGMPVVQNIANGSETITVSAPAGQTLETGKAYYMILVPTEFSSGFSLTFAKGEETAVKYRLANTKIKRSVFGTLVTPDKNLVWGDVNYIVIPDDNFRAYLVQNFDINGNGVLDYAEADAVTEINDLNTDNIYSLAGIEYFTHLNRLYCNGSKSVRNSYYDETTGTKITEYMGGTGQLRTLDLSQNTELTYVSCRYNQLTSIILGNNQSLDQLYCNYNMLESLNLDNCTALTYINCNNNKLSNLDVSKNSQLQRLYCTNNNISSIDLSGNPYLFYLSCSYNQLSTLDVSHNTNLSSLYCYYNPITSLDLSQNSELQTLSCYNAQLTSLNLNGNPLLRSLTCRNNQLTSLDLSVVPNLQTLNCRNNLLTTLDVSQNTELRTLYCEENPYLTEVWLKLGQSIPTMSYDNQVTTIRYIEPSGLSETPVVITTADELQAFLANPVYDVDLGADIDLSGRSVAGTAVFDGIFDGKGFTIRGLTTGSPFFGELNGYVKDLVIDSSCSFAPSVPTFGIIAGVNRGAISNVTNKANVVYTVSSIESPALIAAISGQSSGLIMDCVNEGTVSIVASGATTGLGVAGIVAYQSSVVKNCTNRGPVSFSASYISGKTTVVDAENALPSVGGVCAIGAPGFLMESCHNYGSVTYSLNAAETNLEVNLNRNQIGGVVGSPCGSVKNCNNFGAVNVSIKHSTPGTDLPYEFIACVGGIGGGDYLFTSTSGTISNTSYYNCVNEGNIIVDSDASRSNTAVGGIVGWPGQEKSTSTVVSSCVNRGTITGRGIMKCRLGGIEGGTGNMELCVNEGKVILESGTALSAIGSLCGFHSQSHYMDSCTAGGEVICSASGIETWVGGLVGNMGNATNETGYGCIVNCKITVASYDPQCMGMVVGHYNGTTKPITLGSQSSPIQVSGSINGTPASSSNIYGTVNDLNHTIYYVIN